ncbi:two-component regulator propeller domain-containing protein [Gilvibacter sp.]|uniref:two-component regulator propeller domain-containing protein n=1 Tax=Gilvibacter sp. TaxID=2729997 RepID=UPI003F4A45E1
MKRILLHILLASSLYCWSQSTDRISFSHLTVNDGLSQNSVVHIDQDSSGYMWFATQDGLNRYDGRQFKTYPLQFEDITQDRYSLLGQLSFGPNDEIYALAKGGVLYKYSPTRDEFDNEEAIEDLSCIHLDADGKLWMGTTQGELYYKTTYIQDPIRLPGSYFITRIKTIKDEIWASSDNSIYTVDQKNKSGQWLLSLQDQDALINDFEMDSSGNLWVSTYNNGVYFKTEDGAIRLASEVFEGFELPEGIKLERMLIDSNDNVWLATYGQGVYLWNSKAEQLRHFLPVNYDPNSLNYRDVISLYEDHTGIVWLGTDGGGLNYYDKDLLKFDGIVQSEAPRFANIDVCRAIAVDQTGRIWIGTSGKGLTAYHPQQKKYNGYKTEFNRSKGLPSDRVMSLLAIENRLFIGFQEAGLALLDLNNPQRGFNWLSDPRNPKLEIGTIWSIVQNGSNEQLWLATREQGLILVDFQGEILEQYTHDPQDPQSLPEDNVRAIQLTEQGELWIGTENEGVARLKNGGNHFERYYSLRYANVKSIYSHDDRLWIGTNGNGLFKLDLNSNTEAQFTTADGLPNNVIYGIIPDENNNLWLSSNRGITKVTQTEFDYPNFESYTIFDGLQSLEFNTGAHFRDAQSNTLYFGGLQGVNWFKPQQIRKNSTPPKTTIAQIELHHQPISLEKDMEFKADDNSFTFHFASLHFAQPGRNEFKYKLINHDEDWSAPTTNNLINYTNLTKGDYTFQVISSNYDGVWNNKPSEFAFTILPAWYESNLAKLLYVIFGLLLIYATYRYFKWRWQMQYQLDLEHREAERLKELDELKTRLYTNVAHEFRTPLSLISGPIKQLLKANSDQPEQRELLQIVDNNSQRVVSLADELLELSRLKDGAVRLNIKPHDLDAQLHDLIIPFKGHSGREQVSLEHRLDTFGMQAYDSDVLSKIILNLLSNAFKYAKQGTTIQVVAKHQDNQLHFEIENQSERINQQNIEKLFERHHREHDELPGSGIGLSLLKELVELTQGSVSATTTTNNGVQFRVVMPLTPTAQIPKEQTEIQTSLLKQKTNKEAPVILIAEDDRELLGYTASLFEKQGFEVITVNNGNDAITLGIEKIPDLVLSDIRMPGQDGLQVLAALKANEKTNHIPVFMLTAQAGADDKLAGLELQADAYITKPFDPQLLLQQVKNELNAIERLREKFQSKGRLTKSPTAPRGSQQQFVNRLSELLKKNLTQPDFNAAKLAEDLGMSRMQLHRKLKAVTGVSAQELLLSERLGMAHDLLSQSDLNVSEIAYSCGFNTPSYFSRCFKEKFGSTPAEYRKK